MHPSFWNLKGLGNPLFLQDLQGMSQHLRGFSTLLNDISQHLETLDQRQPNDLTQLKAGG